MTRYQLPPGSLPITCTLEKAEMVPSEALAVEGSARTLTSLVVVPGMGALVGAGVGGSAVTVKAGVADAGRVAVTNSGRESAGVDVTSIQPAAKKLDMTQAIKKFRMTALL
jgi:hypothetical protein